MSIAEENARIFDQHHNSFPVRLEITPNVGDLIELHSFNLGDIGEPPVRRFAVKKVVHYINDISPKTQAGKRGGHSVVIHVEDSEDSAFETSYGLDDLK